MKTTKGGKIMNPTDAYRKELRKKELKRNKKERKKVREVGILKKDPESLKEQINKLEMMKAEGALDKARKHKKRQLEDTLNLVLKKRKEYEEKQKEKGETPVMFSHLGPLRRRGNAEEEERVKHPQPEDSVYYHPTLNPTGAPPPGKPPMFKSTIGPRIPLSEASSSDVASASTGIASTSISVSEGAALSVPPLPPPPPLPRTGGMDAEDGSVLPESLPLPPPHMLPKTELGSNLPLPPLPPPPPGPPPTNLVLARPHLPPPPPPPRPPQQSAQPPPPGTVNSERDDNQPAKPEDPNSKGLVQAPMLPSPLPPPGLPQKLASDQSELAQSESDAKNSLGTKDFSKLIPPPPPPRQQAVVPRPSSVSTLQPDVLPPGISEFPLPPPPPGPPPTDMRPPSMPLGLPGQPGVMAPPPGPPLMMRPPPGPPPMMKPPLPPGPPPLLSDDAALRPSVPQKPSYVKSAASTVVKRPLAQHTPELTAMVPASVRVRREAAAASKPKPKSSSSLPTVSASSKPATLVPSIVKPEPFSSSSAPKSKSIDDSYSAFLEDMKALGALDS